MNRITDLLGLKDADLFLPMIPIHSDTTPYTPGSR